MSFTITTEKFEGPLHVLLSLIEKRKLHISEISLASVTEDFVLYMSTKELDYTEITAFLSIASILLLIKVKSLLPREELATEEVASIDDLTKRLKHYEIIQKFGGIIASSWGTTMWHERAYKTVNKSPMFIPEAVPKIDEIMNILSEVLKTVPVPEKRDTAVVRATVKIEDIIKRFEERITSGSVSWRSDIMTKWKNAQSPAEQKIAKVEIVVSFLAMLEMFKKGLITVTQGDEFNSIDISAI
jgi:segregation and condensation protein A